MKEAGLVLSTSEGFRMIEQGAVKVDEQKIDNKNTELRVGKYVIQVGKRKVIKVDLK